MGLELADLFRLDGIDDSSLLVLRHRPWQPRLANILPSWPSSARTCSTPTSRPKVRARRPHWPTRR